MPNFSLYLGVHLPKRNQYYTFLKKIMLIIFFQHATDVLNTFKSYKVDVISGKKKRRQNEVDTSAEKFFAKYLTNQNLLQLQLSDSNFRRCNIFPFLDTVMSYLFSVKSNFTIFILFFRFVDSVSNFVSISQINCKIQE